MRERRVFSAHKRRKNSVVCFSCGVTLQNSAFQRIPHEKKKLLDKYTKIQPVSLRIF